MGGAKAGPMSGKKGPGGNGGPDPGCEWPQRELPRSLTDDDPRHPALFLCRAGLQSLMNLVCSQVKEVQVIFHGVAVPKPISQADNSYENREVGVTEN